MLKDVRGITLKKGYKKETVAYVNINGKEYYGTNSSLLTQSILN